MLKIIIRCPLNSTNKEVRLVSGFFGLYDAGVLLSILNPPH